MTSKNLARRRTFRVIKDDTRPVAVFLYRRISNDPEGRELGVERQGEDLRSWVAETYPDNVRVHDEYCDNDRSASTNCDTPRPDYDRLMKDAREAAESGLYRRVVIAAYTSARLTRRPTEHEAQVILARDYQVEYHFLRSPSFDLNTAAGRRIARTMAAQDAGLPEDISEQVLRAKEQLLMAGVYTGGQVGLGYRLEYDYKPSGLPIKPGRLVIHEPEAALIRNAVHSFLAGVPLEDIAKQWSAAGVKKRPAAIAEILSRGKNAGLSEWYGQKVANGVWGKPADENDPEGEWSAIITESELAAVRAKLNDRDRKTHHAAYERRWLGPGVYRCGQPGCESTMRSYGGAKAGDGARYGCQDAGHCVIDATTVDAEVRGTVSALLAQYGADLLAGGQTLEREALTRKVTALRGQIDALADAFAESAEDDQVDGKASAAALVATTRRLEKRIAELERDRAKLIVPGATLKGVADADDPVRAFLSATLPRQRAIIAALVTVTIKPGRRGRQPAGTKLADRIAIAPTITGVSAAA